MDEKKSVYSKRIELLNRLSELANTYNSDYQKYPESFQIKFKRYLFSQLQILDCYDDVDIKELTEIDATIKGHEMFFFKRDIIYQYKLKKKNKEYG